MPTSLAPALLTAAEFLVQLSKLSVLAVLPEPVWLARQSAHEVRVRAWTDPHQARASRGEKHPVHDFLFSYYAYRAAWLKRWHPGPDLALTGESARAFLRWPEYREITLPDGTTAVALEPATLPVHRLVFVTWLRDLLQTMQTRPAFFGCFGLHEWAMVYRQTPDEVRHNAYPLRYPPDALAAIVEAAPITCTHFDAFRFFTPPARPLNRLQPTRETTPQHEQRGCLHAGMDLYKLAFKLAPFTPSEQSSPTALNSPAPSAKLTCAPAPTTSPPSATRPSRSRPLPAAPNTSNTSAPSPPAATRSAPVSSPSASASLPLTISHDHI